MTTPPTLPDLQTRSAERRTTTQTQITTHTLHTNHHLYFPPHHIYPRKTGNHIESTVTTVTETATRTTPVAGSPGVTSATVKVTQYRTVDLYEHRNKTRHCPSS
ncbi:hypothetical protein Pcinc_011697 [Petrolisthes cinctipes]|uniref:Uncharacterized protein n=1 Tax=Petrolisthes cinctipes TaxID=88211 RepID=A0AAE1G6C6_PETCI|nr:hypothetical protein Pcinc_011697 [Petrolisthes cinctipes]